MSLIPNSKVAKCTPSRQAQSDGSSTHTGHSTRTPERMPDTSRTLASGVSNEVLSFKFQDLPNELQLGVLSCLPAKEMQRTRRINKHVRGLIDQNQNTISEPGKTRAIARLEHDFKHIIGFDVRSLDVFESLKRIVNHNHQLGYTDSVQSAWWVLSQLWNYKTGESAFYPRLEWFISELVGIQNHALIEVARSQRKPWEWAKNMSREFENDSKSMQARAAEEGWNYEHSLFEPLDPLVDDIFSDVDDLGCSKKDVEKWCKEVFEEGTLRHCYDELWEREPQFELPSEMLEQAFGLPAIPSPLVGIGYCVRTKWASRRACDAFVDGKPTSEIEKAAILEEVFIY
ncbi:hypothetical protein HII31_09539 [Pseudocercospora fuligena]|uniref:F-box domain-containing protein n=1 Tax=Pseudocercospora fuligena TaxID=685502 RepID=A0A8H6VG08_9PEZI|nr:hypothetical protein HII31_09539 [Pseudocercospora fuligena]